MMNEKAQIKIVKELVKQSSKAGFYRWQAGMNGAVAALAIYGLIGTVVYFKGKERKKDKEQPEKETD